MADSWYDIEPCADRPSPPEGPLEVSNVTKESARLAWRIPVDDGGSPILHYVIEKMDVSRGTWSDAGMSSSLSHEVVRLIHRKEYLFRVKAVNSVGESDPLETTKTTIARNEFGELILMLFCVKPYSKFVQLRPLTFNCLFISCNFSQNKYIWALNVMYCKFNFSS